MDNLETIIKQRIAGNGPASFHDFMQWALYEPSMGYYTRKEMEIGSRGDFYTSPHAHPAFGALIARQAMECWRFMGSPEEFHIIEAGGGRGWLAHDMLAYLKGQEMYEALRYTLIELNPHMRSRQKGLLLEHRDKVRWASSVSELRNMRGIMLSNELIDAFPVHLLEYRESWKEVYISFGENGELEQTLSPIIDDELMGYAKDYLAPMAEGARAEVNLRARKYLGEVYEALREGFVLTIDYGYPASDLHDPERPQGTLLCYRGHDTSEDFLQDIGNQDITAHINFTDLRRNGDKLGLRGLGFARQGVYLVSLGFDDVVSGMRMSQTGDRPGMGRETHMLQNLVMPGTMGDTHKVLLQYKGPGQPEPRGFAMKNELWKLG